MAYKIGQSRLRKLVAEVLGEVPLEGETVEQKQVIYDDIRQHKLYDGTFYYSFRFLREGSLYVGGDTVNGNTEVIIDAAVNRGSQFNIRVSADQCRRLSVAFARAQRLAQKVEALKK